jgi:hypothetical protein
MYKSRMILLLQGLFTDDRNVLVIKPGRKSCELNYMKTGVILNASSGTFLFVERRRFIGENNKIVSRITIQSKAMLENLQPTEKKAHYKRYWSYK